MSNKVEFKTYKEMPIRPMTLGDMSWNQTGSWRNVRPYYVEKMSPCRIGCPAGENIQRYIYLVTEGSYQEAWRTIMESNPMPAVTGRVCFHPCMDKCTRSDFDEAINIPAIERWLGDLGLENRDWMEAVRADKSEKIAVVGGGPAGLSCAFFLARRGYPVTIFEAENALGGVLRWGIPEYRLPNSILDNVIAAILEAGPIKVESGTAVGEDISFEEIEDGFEAVFLGMGLSRSRKLGVGNEDMEGVEAGLDFLRKVNSGESVSPGERVVVIGGGNTAIDVARSALRAGSDVTVVYRRTMNEMPAIRDEVEEAEREGVNFRFLASPAEISGSKGKLKKVVFQEMELGEPDESGRRRPVPVKGKQFTMNVDNMYTAIGEQANLESMEKLVECQWNLVKTKDEWGSTSRKNVFSGGDVVTGAASVVEAIAAGRSSAQKINSVLSGEKIREEEEREEVGIDNINTAYFKKSQRTKVPRIPVKKAIKGYQEIYTGFDSEMLKTEADRCFSCGVCNNCDNCWMFCPDVAIKRLEEEYEINYDYCKGCLVCVVECPRSCISTREEGK
jgi:NADPH-dependent glutamate synthase beta subunit-like oxidoreductase